MIRPSLILMDDGCGPLPEFDTTSEVTWLFAILYPLRYSAYLVGYDGIGFATSFISP